MSQLIYNVKNVLSQINSTVTSSDDCNSILDKSSNVLAAAAKEDSITADLANDVVRIIAEVDDMTKKVACNIDMLVRVWNFYLPLLKKFHTLWNSAVLSTCVDHLLLYTFDGIVSVVHEVSITNSSQSLSQVSDVLRSKLPLLNFFFQRLFATLVYRGRDISPEKINSALLQLGTLRGALSSLNQPEIVSVKDKFDTLLLRSMGFIEKSSNLCEDNLWTAFCNITCAACSTPADICATYQLPKTFVKFLLRGLLFQSIEHLKCICRNKLRVVMHVTDIVDVILKLFSTVPMYPQLMSDMLYLQLMGHTKTYLREIYMQFSQQSHDLSSANNILIFLLSTSLNTSSCFHRLRSAVTSVFTCAFVAELSLSAQRHAIGVVSLVATKVFSTNASMDILSTVCSFILRMSVAVPRHSIALVELLKTLLDSCGKHQVTVLDALCSRSSENEKQKQIIAELQNYALSRKAFYDENMTTFWCYDGNNSHVVVSSALRKICLIAKYIEVVSQGGANPGNSALNRNCVAESIHRAMLHMRPWSRGIFCHRTSLNQSHKSQLFECLCSVADVCVGRYDDRIALLTMMCACDLLVCLVRVISSTDCGRLVPILDKLYNATLAASSSTSCAEWSCLLSSMVSFRSEISSIDVKKQVRNIVPAQVPSTARKIESNSAQMVSLIQARSNQQIHSISGARSDVGYESRVVQMFSTTRSIDIMI